MTTTDQRGHWFKRLGMAVAHRVGRQPALSETAPLEVATVAAMGKATGSQTPSLASGVAQLPTYSDGCNQEVELLPSLGYIGYAPADMLVLPLSEPVTGLRLEVASADGKALLTLHGAGLYKGGRRLDLGSKATAQQSSVYKDDPKHGPESLLAGRGIHTQAEPVAWWTAEFSDAVDASEVRIVNLRDRWALRAAALAVYVRAPDGQWRRVYAGRSGAQALLALSDIAALCGPFEFDRRESIAVLRQRLLRGLAASLLKGEHSLKDLNWRHVLSIIDVWGRRPLSDDELTVLAARLLPTHALDPLMSFTAKLPDRGTVLQLQARMNEISEARGDGTYVLTRHGVQRSRLLSRKEDYIASIQAVMAVLAAAGKSPMLCYGTLLGAVRDKGFIPHDDDVDLLYRCQAQSREGVQEEMKQVAKSLTDSGFVVRNVPPGLNMHAFDQQRGGLMVDIFPCWIQDGAAHLHMERMAIRSIDPDVLYPLSSMELYGVTLPAPAHPERLLQERYGADWPVSNQFFEWPWPLTDTAPANQ